MKLQLTLSKLDPEDIARIRQVASFLEKDISHHYDVPDLAEMVCINRNKLQTIFAIVYGMGPYAYLQTLRTEKAKEMLLDHYTMRQISVAVGFNGVGAVNNFIKFFKKQTSYTPLIYRRQHQSRIAS
jgi:transcriptional regulator GlxA family with amidase domain